MGNCQAIDAASLVIQHPSGRVQRLYWSITAAEVMRTNPGHYIALVINLCLSSGKENHQNFNGNGGAVRVTRVKLLKPTDLLVLGQAYRLISSQDVMKGLWAKKQAKMMKKELESTEISARERQNKDTQETNQVATEEKHRCRAMPSASSRSRQWRPSLQSISEADFHTNREHGDQPERTSF